MTSLGDVHIENKGNVLFNNRLVSSVVKVPLLIFISRRIVESIEQSTRSSATSSSRSIGVIRRRAVDHAELIGLVSTAVRPRQ